MQWTAQSMSLPCFSKYMDWEFIFKLIIMMRTLTLLAFLVASVFSAQEVSLVNHTNPNYTDVCLETTG